MKNKFVIIPCFHFASVPKKKNKCSLKNSFITFLTLGCFYVCLKLKRFSLFVANSRNCWLYKYWSMPFTQNFTHYLQVEKKCFCRLLLSFFPFSERKDQIYSIAFPKPLTSCLLHFSQLLNHTITFTFTLKSKKIFGY